MSIAGTHNPILDASNGLLMKVTNFDRQQRNGLDYEQFRQSIDDGFTDFSECLRLQQQEKQQIETSKYALAAFIDEVVMTSEWTEKSQWMANTLQWQYFGEHRGGEGFFHRIAEIRQKGAEEINLLEVYYLCLELGFQGMYRVFQNEKLDGLKRELRQLIERYRDYDDLRLSANVAMVSQAQKKSTRFQTWQIAAAVAGFMLLVFIGFSLAINTVSSSTEKALSQYSATIKSLVRQQHYKGGAR